MTDADLARWEAAERSGHRALGPDASGERILALIAEVRRLRVELATLREEWIDRGIERSLND